MRVQRLRVADLRNIVACEIDFEPGWNLLVGANGAGKTSVLEAAFLLSHGHSFRTSQRDALSRNGTPGFQVFAELSATHRRMRLGLSRQSGRLEARIDGENAAIGELMRHVAVVCLEPGSHELIAGASESRRRFLNWGVFHVEHAFLDLWRRYQRALRQRNACLRAEVAVRDLDAWDHEVARTAEPLITMHRAYVDRLRPHAMALLHEMLPELATPRLDYLPGFEPSADLLELLRLRRDRDLARGHTSVGPHRADWSISFEAAPRREHLSRGQEKLCAFALLLAQARRYAEDAGHWPLICLDDLASEVDADHQRRLVAAVAAGGAQVLATGTREPEAIGAHGLSRALFHVEQGRIRRAD